MSPGDIHALTATRARRAIVAQDISPAELLAACRARIATRDPAIGAFARLETTATIPVLGALAGVPVAIKDIVDTAGLGTEYGSPVFAGHVPAADADCVRRLKAAGAVVLGKTVTTEFAHVTPKATRNPRDPARTPGGSSSGSAAAVADFMAPLAIGTQTGGSVIRPASFCGTFGFKSSIGRTNTQGVHELARSLDTVGWFARSAGDLRLMGSILLDPPRTPAPRRARPRLACLTTPYDPQAEPGARDARDKVCRQLSGVADIVPVTLPAAYGELNALHRRIVSVEAARAFDAYEKREPGKLSAALREFMELGRANEAGYAAALTQADAARRSFDDDIAHFDAFVLPAAPGEAPIGLGSTGEATFSLFLSLLGPPCVTLPAATGPAGMPIGVQFVAARGRDEELLDLAGWAAENLGLAVD
jgi:Asp-tRNA(Asn)/Glu-tRNA(Gln) amidotransferase A subunit family amidase